MSTSPHLILALACVLGTAAASAHEAAATAGTPPTASQAGKPAAAKDKPRKKGARRPAKPDSRATQPDRPADANEPEQRKPAVRRAVPAVIERVNPAGAPVYGPVLAPLPAPAGTPRPNPGVPAPSVPSGPPLMNSCDGGGCTGTSGGRFNGGVGTTLIGPQGQACVRGAAGVQCN